MEDTVSKKYEVYYTLSKANVSEIDSHRTVEAKTDTEAIDKVIEQIKETGFACRITGIEPVE